MQIPTRTMNANDARRGFCCGIEQKRVLKNTKAPEWMYECEGILDAGQQAPVDYVAIQPAHG